MVDAEQVPSPEIHELLTEPAHEMLDMVQFRDRFHADVASAEHRVIIETMFYGLNDATLPFFNDLHLAIANRVPDVRFNYDALSEAYNAIGPGLIALSVAGDPGGKHTLTNVDQTPKQLLASLAENGVKMLRTKRHRDRQTGEYFPVNHAKYVIVDDVVYFGTNNLTPKDFKMSNFVFRVSDPTIVNWFMEVSEDTGTSSSSKVDDLLIHNTDGELTHRYMLSPGIPGESPIIDTAISMLDDLEAGDRAVFVTQWPPIRFFLRQMLEAIEAAAERGATIDILMNPEDKHFPIALGSRMLQRSVLKHYGRLESNIRVHNLAQETHAKILYTVRSDDAEQPIETVCTGSDDLTSVSSEKGVRELVVFSRAPGLVSSVKGFINQIASERPGDIRNVA